MSPLRSATLLLLTLTIGCGTENRSTDPSPTSIPFQSGPLTGATSGPVGSPRTTTSPGATLTGLVGTFTTLTAGGPAAGTVATVYFASAVNSSIPPGLWQVRTDGTGLQQLLPDWPTGLSVSPSGKRQLFWEEGGETGVPPWTHALRYLTERLPDGTTHRLTSDVDALTPVSWAPDELSVIYPVRYDSIPTVSVIRRFVFGSAGPQDLLREIPDSFISLLDIPQLTVGRANGRTVVIHDDAFGPGLKLLDVGSGIDSPYLIPTDSANLRSPDLSQDGRIAFIATRPVGNGVYRSQLKVGDVNHPEAASALPFRKDSRDSYRDQVRWLSDGSGMVVLANGPPFAPSFNAQLVLIDDRGNFVRQLTTYPRTVGSGFSVGPSKPASLALIGADGLLGSTTSGIIFGQDSTGGLSAVLGFHSDDPGSVSLVANTGLNSTGPALTYTLTAEGLRTLRFINGPPDGDLITVLDSTSGSAAGALVNFAAGNGVVTVVLPFTQDGAGAATVTDEGGQRVFRGSFLSAWSGRTNLAPHGASELRLDLATGRTEVTP